MKRRVMPCHRMRDGLELLVFEKHLNQTCVPVESTWKCGNSNAIELRVELKVLFGGSGFIEIHDS